MHYIELNFAESCGFKNGLSKFGVHHQTYVETPAKGQAPCGVLAVFTVLCDAILVPLPILFSRDSHEDMLLGSREDASLERGMDGAEKPVRNVLQKTPRKITMASIRLKGMDSTNGSEAEMTALGD